MDRQLNALWHSTSRTNTNWFFGIPISHVCKLARSRNIHTFLLRLVKGIGCLEKQASFKIFICCNLFSLSVILFQVCNIVAGQRCIKKLTDNQTSTMIRATARSAPDRQDEISKLVSVSGSIFIVFVYLSLLCFILNIYFCELQMRSANFNTDPYVREFGVMVRDEMTEVNGRVLQAPSILYGGRVWTNSAVSKSVKNLINGTINGVLYFEYM